jgi:signal transduction histidine kinase
MDSLFNPGKAHMAEDILAGEGEMTSYQLERGQTEEQKQEQANRLQSLAEAFLAINSLRHFEEMLWFITAKAREIIGTHQSLASITVQGNGTRPIISLSFSDKYAAWREHDGQHEDYEFHTLVQATNKPRRLTSEELKAHPVWNKFTTPAENRPPLSGLLVAPIIGREQRNLGLLLLSDKYTGEFTEEDESILVQLAQMAAVAIENTQLYLQAQEAVHERDKLLSTVTHDLKNPLAAIKGFAQLLQRSIKDMNPEDAERLTIGLSRIEATATKMTALINELLDLSRLQMGQPLELDLQLTDLVTLARQVAAEQQQTTERHQIGVETTVAELVGLFDNTRLERVLTNLISNAIKYDPEGNAITVVVAREEGNEQAYAVLAVRDRGIGIPAKDLPHVFEQFRRASNAPEYVSGTGIGLASARYIAEQHGGTITVTSKVGEGSIFTVRLPLLLPVSNDERRDTLGRG